MWDAHQKENGGHGGVQDPQLNLMPIESLRAAEDRLCPIPDRDMIRHAREGVLPNPSRNAAQGDLFGCRRELAARFRTNSVLKTICNASSLDLHNLGDGRHSVF